MNEIWNFFLGAIGGICEFFPHPINEIFYFSPQPTGEMQYSLIFVDVIFDLRETIDEIRDI